MHEREIVESILAKSKLKEEDIEEIDNLTKRDLFEKYYNTQIGSWYQYHKRSSKLSESS